MPVPLSCPVFDWVQTYKHSKTLQAGSSIKMIRLQIQMNLNDFLMATGNFPVDMVGAPVNILADIWNEDMTWMVDMIAPRHPLSTAGSQYLFGLLRGCGWLKDKGDGQSDSGMNPIRQGQIQKLILKRSPQL